MTNKIKTISVISFFVALLSILVLSAGLSSLELHAGFQLQGENSANLPDRTYAELIPEGSNLLLVVNGILALASLTLLVYLIVRLSVYIHLKSVGMALLAIAVLFGVIYMVPETEQGQTSIRMNAYDNAETTPPPADYGEPIGEPPEFLYMILVIAGAIGLGYLAYSLIRDWRSSREAESALKLNAQAALDDLKGGIDFKNVILRCYFQMADTLRKEQGVERQEAMTVREFEEALEKMGYPPDPVHQLTHLFERIRYGAGETTQDDERTAIESLDAILRTAQQKGDTR